MTTDVKVASAGGRWQGGGPSAPGGGETNGQNDAAKSEMNASLLRAARGGNAEKVG